MDSVKSHAKVNTFLSIIGKKDNGYHDLDMVMVELDLHDVINFEINDQNEDVLECNNPDIPTDSRNTILKAIKVLRSNYEIKNHYKIFLDKQTPTEAGMGTGSSNAATVIKYINQVENLNLTKEELIAIAHQVGSDVPFFIYGKCAIVQGEGEIVKPINDFPMCYMVIARPDSGLSTKEVFESIKEYKHISSSEHVKAINEKDLKQVLATMHNDFEELSKSLNKEIQVIIDKLRMCNANQVLMTGSGPSVFAVFSDYEQAFAAQKALKSEYKHTYLTKIRD